MFVCVHAHLNMMQWRQAKSIVKNNNIGYSMLDSTKKRSIFTF